MNLKALLNLGKIKDYAVSLFLVVVKLRNVLEFLEKELDNTKLGTKLALYLPKVKSALATVVDTVKKVLVFFGEDTTEAQALGASDLESELNELERELNKLRGK